MLYYGQQLENHRSTSLTKVGFAMELVATKEVEVIQLNVTALKAVSFHLKDSSLN